MRLILRVLFGMLKAGAVLSALVGLAALVFSLTDSGEQRRYILDVSFDGDCED